MEYCAYISTPVGNLEITADQEAITQISVVKNAKAQKGDVPQHVRLCIQQLQEYFDGRRKDFDLPLRFTGTQFQEKVWKELQAIPYGKTRSYGDMAKRLRKPGASRAVGGANNKNPLMIVVPCHRVIGSTGSLVGYAGGLDKKEWLLKHEGVL